METLQLWATPVVKLNVADRYDMSLYADEVFNLFSMTGGEDDQQLCVNKELFPIIMAMRDEVVTPAVRQFISNHFNYEMKDHYVDTNGKWIAPGEGLFPHFHPGSVVSAICYPSDSKDGMTMFDPRGNACRGYPKKMRNSPHFANFKVSPNAGDIYIFPSYVQHSVAHVNEEIRLSLLHEYYIITDL